MQIVDVAATKYGAMYFIFIWIAQSIDSYEGTHTCTHRAHRMCRNAYAITNSTITTTTMLKWKKYKEGSYDNFRGNSLHPHMTCIWISIKKESTHHPYIHMYVHVQAYVRSRKLYCFFMHMDFLFLCYRSAHTFLHPSCLPFFGAIEYVAWFQRKFSQFCVQYVFLWCDTTM